MDTAKGAFYAAGAIATLQVVAAATGGVADTAFMRVIAIAMAIAGAALCYPGSLRRAGAGWALIMLPWFVALPTPLVSPGGIAFGVLGILLAALLWQARPRPA